ncbi:DctP family TRAP transporter solute-binding subunit [Iocasia frigidifontis]|uniref:DctP family TRAP transporter solute-binding subunit n=1 Tax=Iocasia fonsfrigidae TaxID=2682810 RepID=A0A8A7KBC7_9FIRM|nr:TRAP transporter substrate-binding protein [Iocasia fonsfrigidae]QTL96848.1 DctP family TRAP transporter solute-binding subunit [Iocasia fonsfrigidae]
MKRFFVIALLMVMVFGMVSISAAKDYQMIVALSEPLDSEQGEGAKEFKRLIEERTDGQIEVKLFPNEQLGKEVDAITAMQMGTVDMGIFGTTIFKQAAPKYNIWSAYYIFNSPEELMYVLNGSIGEEMNQAMIKNKDIRIIGYGLRGPRNLTTNYPVRKPSDVKGLDIRVPLQPIYVESWKALGAQPQTIAYSELYTAIKQGVVDAQENPLANIEASALYEVNDYVNVTEHQRAFYTYAVSQKFFNKLTPKLQGIITKTGKDVTEFHTKLQQSNEAKLRKQLEEKGMEFIEVDQAAFKEALSHIPDRFANKWVPGLYQRIQEKVEEFHAQQN